MGESNRVSIRIIQESTWGTLPSTPTMQALRFTSQSFRHAIENSASKEIRADGNQTDTTQVNKSASGSLAIELSATSFDALIVAAMRSSWVGDSIVNGVTPVSFSIEKAHLDLDEYFLYTGMMVNTFGLNIQAGSEITGSFEFLGKIPTTALAQATNASVVSAATTTNVMNAIGNIGTILEGGIALTGVYLKEVSFSISNNLRVRPAIGYDSAIDIKLGKQEVTGKIVAYFTSDRLYDKFIAGTASSLVVPVTDAAGNSYTFTFPNIKFENDEDSGGGGSDTDVLEDITFRALYDGSTGGQIQIDRVVA